MFRVLKLAGLKGKPLQIALRSVTTAAPGIISPKPNRESFGLMKTCLAVVPGILIGAFISKTVANFLEENELFVPSDEDDDDD